MKDKKKSWKLVAATFLNCLMCIVIGFVFLFLMCLGDYVGPDGQLSLEAGMRAQRQGKMVCAGMTAYGILGVVLALVWRKGNRVISGFLTVHILLIVALTLLVGVEMFPFLLWAIPITNPISLALLVFFALFLVGNVVAMIEIFGKKRELVAKSS
jgi:hypothetical protein